MKIDTIEDIKNFFAHAHLPNSDKECFITKKLLEQWLLEHHILIVNNKETPLIYQKITKKVYAIGIQDEELEQELRENGIY